MMMGHSYYHGGYSNGSSYSGYSGGHHGMMMRHSTGYRGYSTGTSVNAANTQTYGRRMSNSAVYRSSSSLATYRTSTTNVSHRGGMATGGHHYLSGTRSRSSVAARYLAQSRTNSR